jgi:hypothetical protein
MHRREFNRIAPATVGLLALCGGPRAFALGLSSLTNAEASQGLKTALERGAASAVGLLGRPDGFLANPKVRIPLPGYLSDAAKFMRTLGRAAQIDELETAMNRAAEAAVPQARELLAQAVKTMTVTDAKQILTGGDTSVTAFFESRTRAPLTIRFLPVVTRATEKVGLADKYNRVASKAAGIGLVKQEDADIQHYVTRKTLDGLYFMIGEEERKIRRDPVGTGSALLGKVFGAVK